MADTTKKAKKEDIETMQSGIAKFNATKIKNYSLFLGGLDTTHEALAQYDPLRTGYGRIFFVRMPFFMKCLMPNATQGVKHMLEYGNTGITGLGNTTLDFEQFTGGYAGKSFDIPTVAKDETTEITIQLYEFAGSPIREYMEMWISGISDPNTGLATLHNARNKNDERVKYTQANITAEAFFVHTGPTGRADDIQYACFLTNMMPKQATKDHFEYTSGDHKIVQISQTFTCVKYESKQINEVAKALIKKYVILRDFLDFQSGWTAQDILKKPSSDIKAWTERSIRYTDYSDDAEWAEGKKMDDPWLERNADKTGYVVTDTKTRVQ